MIDQRFINSGELDRGVFDPFYGEYIDQEVQDKIVQEVLTSGAESGGAVEFSIYDSQKNLREWSRSTSYGVKNDKFQLDIFSDIKSADVPDGSGFIARYNFFDPKLGSFDDGRLFVQTVSDNRREVRVRIDPKRTLPQQDFNQFFSEFNLKSLKATANFKNNQYFHILRATPVVETDDSGAPIIEDGEFAFEGSAIIKFLQELPPSISQGDEFWIDEEITRPYFDRFNIFRGVEPKPVNELAPPDFSVEVKNPENGSSSFESFEDITKREEFTTTEEFLESRINSSQSVELNVDFTEFENFIHFSSAEERLQNFQFKVQQLEQTLSEINALGGGPQSAGREETLRRRIEQIIGSFDVYEKWLFQSDSERAYPKNSDGGLRRPDSPQVQQWFNDIIQEARTFDNRNDSALRKQVPEFVREDPESEDFVLFVDLVAQWFDVNWIYIDHLEYLTDQNENAFAKESLSSELSRNVIESLGLDTFNGFDAEEFFDEVFDSEKIDELFGNADVRKPSGVELDGFKLDMTRFQAQQQIWRRLLTNLTHYYKTKGTPTSIDVLSNIFGVYTNSLVVREDGGAAAADTDTANYKLNETSHFLSFFSSQNITIPWELDSTFQQSSSFNNLFDDFENYPKSTELRFRSEFNGGVPLKLLEIEDSAEIRLERTKLGTDRGKVILEVREADGTRVTAETQEFSLFNGKWTNVLVQLRKEEPFVDLFVQQRSPFGEINIREQASIQIGLQTALEILNSPNVKIGGTPGGTQRFPEGTAFVGDLDQITIWQDVVSGNQFDLHSIAPSRKDVDNQSLAVKDSIHEKDIQFLRKELLFRTDFRVPKNLTVDNTIENQSEQEGDFDVSTVKGTANGFPSAKESPWQYNRYNRTSFYDSRQIGATSYFNVKVTVGDNELTDNLQPNQSVEERDSELITKDSRQLGVFFSPYTSANRDVFSEIGIESVNSVLGNPKDQRRSTYYTLNRLNEMYWNKYEKSVDVQRFIRYIDQFYSAIFQHVENSVPARSSLTDGIVIEPTVLERDREPIPIGEVQKNRNFDVEVQRSGGAIVEAQSAVLNSGIPDTTSTQVDFGLDASSIRNEDYPEIFVSDQDPDANIGEEGDIWFIEEDSEIDPSDDQPPGPNNDWQGRDVGFIYSGAEEATNNPNLGENRDLWLRFYDGPKVQDRVNFSDLKADELLEAPPDKQEGENNDIFAFFIP